MTLPSSANPGAPTDPDAATFSDAKVILWQMGLESLPGAAESSGDRVRVAFALHLAGRRSEAAAICREVLEREPRHAGAIHLLAVIAHAQKQLGPASQMARMAVAAAPGVPGYRNTLGIILGDLRQWDECLAAFAEAARLDPAGFEAHRNLGVAFSKGGRLDDAAAPLRRAAEIRPNDPDVWTLLASLHFGRLDLAAAIDCRRRALALRPDDAAAHSDLLVTLHYSPDYWPEQIFAEHLAWARRHEEPILLSHPARPFENDRDPGRPLRVGYLSGDFRDHPMSRFFLPLLDGHDHKQYTVYCYGDVRRRDRQTEQLQARADVWRDASALDDDALAEAIRNDRIDVLVDLAGHLDNRRLLVFSRRPAPVQVTYIGYPNTTGMRSIGYRITDAFHDPVDSSADQLHTEQLIRLPGCCWAFDAGSDPPPPDVNQLPAAATGRVTFAVFNRLIKVTETMGRLWARILRRVAGSRLLVLDSAVAGDASLRRALDRLGLSGADIVVCRRGTRAEYLARYNEVDIALDTHPYAGMTTTCDAMWMGVPTVTLAGDTHVSRAGVSLLSAVGLPELIARTPEEYVEIAVRLASNLPRLAVMRAGLRERMRHSPLCDGPRLAREVEAAYREMWREWCAGERR